MRSMSNPDAYRTPRRGWIGRVYDGLQIARVRRAHVGSSFESSSQHGYEGLIADFHEGLRALTPEERASADDRVFHAIFMGSVGIAILRTAAEWAPRPVAQVAAAIAPAALSYLLGDAKRVESTVSVLPHCRFRSEGGPDLCEHACRVPTERFCTDRLRLPVVLEPDPRSMACTWRWGAAPSSP